MSDPSASIPPCPPSDVVIRYPSPTISPEPLSPCQTEHRPPSAQTILGHGEHSCVSPMANVSLPTQPSPEPLDMVPKRPLDTTNSTMSLSESAVQGTKRQKQSLPIEQLSSIAPPKTSGNDLLQLDETHVRIVIDILGALLAKTRLDIKQELACESEQAVPTAVVHLFLQRLDETSDKDKIIHLARLGQVSQRTADLYCLMTGFLTTYLAFTEILLQDLMEDGSCQSSLEAYMALFDSEDNIFQETNTLFLWHFLRARQSGQLLQDLRTQLRSAGIRFHSLQLIDTIFSRFYTTHFLEAAAQKHQKEHGQFYTPQSVVEFMWNKYTTSSKWASRVTSGYVPRVFDPCMGIGAFLCAYLSRLVDTYAATPLLWSDRDQIRHLLTTAIPDNVWGVEIDPFAFKLGKLNFIVHLFPFYKRLVELGGPLTACSVSRLRLFCNDTLKLAIRNDGNRRQDAEWEEHQLERLRNANDLKFDYIVTNPPYMIRKTGFITDPDPVLYNSQVLGGRGMQAYVYFMWLCMQRCDPHQGEVCLITPSQWMVLEFAENIRSWMWQNCKLLEIYQFEPYKVWPKIQTDSLIFRLRMRTAVDEPDEPSDSNQVMFLRHTNRRLGLEAILKCYAAFDHTRPDERPTDLMYRLTRTDAIDRIKDSPHASLSFLIPTSSVFDRLQELTAHLPRLCDGEIRAADVPTSNAPLIFHRGPNTHPVYALVVRTRWALETFGVACCNRWLRPVFYWSGKSASECGATSKESAFWKERDPLRLSKKENSPAEAYVPFGRVDDQDDRMSFYSMILVDKIGADILKADYALGDQSQYAALYRYLVEARRALQDNKPDRDLAWCHFNKSGMDVGEKLVHPINNGYFTRTQPRQRFFIDRQHQCVTNQCVYFTINPSYPWQSMDFFSGLLNSSLLQFFIRAHCYYDQQGRTRLFGKNLAKIPFANPVQTDVAILAVFVQHMTVIREYMFTGIRLTDVSSLMDKVRGCTWALTDAEIERLQMFEAKMVGWRQLLTRQLPGHWIGERIQQRTPPQHLSEELTRLLKAASLLQYLIDHVCFAIYCIPQDIQEELEQELDLTLTQTWQSSVERPPPLWTDRILWSHKMMHILKTLID